jgi:hypothetical protein
MKEKEKERKKERKNLFISKVRDDSGDVVFDFDDKTRFSLMNTNQNFDVISDFEVLLKVICRQD